MVRRRTKAMNSLYASVASSWAVVSLDVKVMELRVFASTCRFREIKR